MDTNVNMYFDIVLFYMLYDMTIDHIFFLLFLFFFIIECRKVTIIADSIAKNLYGMDGVTLQIFCGDTIAKIASKIDSGEARLDPFDFVIIHVGTNDIDNRAPFHNIISDYGNLVGICKKKKPSIQIVLSAILPRPKDHVDTDSMIRRVNKYLRTFMSKSMRFKFVCTYKPFMFAGRVRNELFAKRDKGLHLNTEGTNTLKRFLIRVISTL